MKTAMHSRMQPEIKKQAEGILHRLDLSCAEAIPNKETTKALKDSRNGYNLQQFDSTEKLFESWDA